MALAGSSRSAIKMQVKKAIESWPNDIARIIRAFPLRAVEPGTVAYGGDLLRILRTALNLTYPSHNSKWEVQHHPALVPLESTFRCDHSDCIIEDGLRKVEVCGGTCETVDRSYHRVDYVILFVLRVLFV
eukprot:scaffold120978_cov44-Attheya_sp.AAC.1